MPWCRPLARACGRDAAVLQQTLALVEAAARTDESSEYYEEAGYQHALLCDYGRAMEAYQAAARVGGTSAAGAIHGQIYCQVNGRHINGHVNGHVQPLAVCVCLKLQTV
jgi:hypothetical protein